MQLSIRPKAQTLQLPRGALQHATSNMDKHRTRGEPKLRAWVFSQITRKQSHTVMLMTHTATVSKSASLPLCPYHEYSLLYLCPSKIKPMSIIADPFQLHSELRSAAIAAPCGHSQVGLTRVDGRLQVCIHRSN